MISINYLLLVSSIDDLTVKETNNWAQIWLNTFPIFGFRNVEEYNEFLWKRYNKKILKSRANCDYIFIVR